MKDDGIYYGDPVNRSSPLARGLVAWWKVLPWYKSGPRWIELAGVPTRSHGVLTNGPTWVAAPGLNSSYGAVSFDGSNDQAVVTNIYTHPVTVLMWVFITGTMLNGSFFKSGLTAGGASGFGDGWAIGVGNGTMDSAGNELIGLYEGRSWRDPNVSIGTGWHHVGWSIASDTAATFWLDGKEAATTAATTLDTATGSNSYIGGYAQGATNRYFAGQMDDVLVWNRTIVAHEAKQIFEESRRGYPALLNRVRSRVMFGVTAAGGTGVVAAKLVRSQARLAGVGGLAG